MTIYGSSCPSMTTTLASAQAIAAVQIRPRRHLVAKESPTAPRLAGRRWPRVLSADHQNQRTELCYTISPEKATSHAEPLVVAVVLHGTQETDLTAFRGSKSPSVSLRVRPCFPQVRLLRVARVASEVSATRSSSSTRPFWPSAFRLVLGGRRPHLRSRSIPLQEASVYRKSLMQHCLTPPDLRDPPRSGLERHVYPSTSDLPAPACFLFLHQSSPRAGDHQRLLIHRLCKHEHRSSCMTTSGSTSS